MKTLREILLSMPYCSNKWGVYAKKMNGEFCAESPARIGMTAFQLKDDFELVGTCDYLARLIDDELSYYDLGDEWDLHQAVDSIFDMGVLNW